MARAYGSFSMKKALHMLFEILAVCILHYNIFFSIAMLFGFIVFYFKCNFGLYLQVQVNWLCIIIQLHFALCLLMSLWFQVVLYYEMGLQVHNQRSEGLPAYTILKRVKS